MTTSQAVDGSKALRPIPMARICPRSGHGVRVLDWDGWFISAKNMHRMLFKLCISLKYHMNIQVGANIRFKSGQLLE